MHFCLLLLRCLIFARFAIFLLLICHFFWVFCRPIFQSMCFLCLYWCLSALPPFFVTIVCVISMFRGAYQRLFFNTWTKCLSCKHFQTNYKPQTTSTPLTSEKSPSNPQQYCLRWNNYTSNLTNVFDQLLHNESFVDVTLACDGKSIKAHKMVLSACSPYFQSLFFENPCQHPIVILRDVKWSELKSVVEFMYKGEINLAHDEIGPLLNVAEMLKIRGLADVKGDHDAIKLEHSSSLPEIIPVAKQPKITASPDWDLNKIDFLMRNASAVSPASSTTTSTVTTIRNQRKRNWPNGGTSALATSIIPSNIANSTGNHTISLSSRNLKNNNGNSSTSNSNSSKLTTNKLEIYFYWQTDSHRRAIMKMLYFVYFMIFNDRSTFRHFKVFTHSICSWFMREKKTDF